MLFLLLMAAVNYLLSQRIRHVGLLLGSFVFYYLGAKQFCLLLLALCLITWLSGLLTGKFRKSYVYAAGVFCVLAALHVCFFCGEDRCLPRDRLCLCSTPTVTVSSTAA